MSAAQVCEVELTSPKFDRKVHEAIREVPFEIRQGPVIVSVESSTAWTYRLAHPSRGAVSIFRSLSNTVEEKVLFKIYRSSQGLTREELEILGNTPDCVSLERNKILFVKGDVWMDIVIPDKGSFVWQGNGGNAMGIDILSPACFPFIDI